MRVDTWTCLDNETWNLTHSYVHLVGDMQAGTATSTTQLWEEYIDMGQISCYTSDIVGFNLCFGITFHVEEHRKPPRNTVYIVLRAVPDVAWHLNLAMHFF